METTELRNEEKILSEIEFVHATDEDNSAEVREMFSMNNVDRAELGQAAVATHPDTNKNDAPTNVADMLSNVMHFCRMTGIDFDECVDRAKMHFDAETAGMY